MISRRMPVQQRQAGGHAEVAIRVCPYWPGRSIARTLEVQAARAHLARSRRSSPRPARALVGRLASSGGRAKELELAGGGARCANDSGGSDGKVGMAAAAHRHVARDDEERHRVADHQREPHQGEQALEQGVGQQQRLHAGARAPVPSCHAATFCGMSIRPRSPLAGTPRSRPRRCR